MKILKLFVLGFIIGLGVVYAPPAQAYESRLGTVSTDGGVGAAQLFVVGLPKVICIHCTNPDAGTSEVRYTVGTSSSIQTATTTNSSFPILFPGDCYRISLMGNDRISIIEKSGTGAFACEIDRVDQ